MPTPETDDDDTMTPEEAEAILEDAGVPADIIEEAVSYLQNHETAKSLGARQVDGYLAGQHERLAKLHREEQHEKEVDKLARSTLAGVEGSESEAVVDALFYEEDV